MDDFIFSVGAGYSGFGSYTFDQFDVLANAIENWGWYDGTTHTTGAANVSYNGSFQNVRYNLADAAGVVVGF